MVQCFDLADCSASYIYDKVYETMEEDEINAQNS